MNQKGFLTRLALLCDVLLMFASLGRADVTTNHPDALLPHEHASNPACVHNYENVCANLDLVSTSEWLKVNSYTTLVSQFEDAIPIGAFPNLYLSSVNFVEQGTDYSVFFYYTDGTNEKVFNFGKNLDHTTITPTNSAIFTASTQPVKWAACFGDQLIMLHFCSSGDIYSKYAGKTGTVKCPEALSCDDVDTTWQTVPTDQIIIGMRVKYDSSYDIEQKQQTKEIQALYYPKCGLGDCCGAEIAISESIKGGIVATLNDAEVSFSISPICDVENCGSLSVTIHGQDSSVIALDISQGPAIVVSEITQIIYDQFTPNPQIFTLVVTAANESPKKYFEIPVELLLPCAANKEGALPTEGQQIDYEYSDASASTQTVSFEKANCNSCYFTQSLSVDCGSILTETNMIPGNQYGPFTFTANEPTLSDHYFAQVSDSSLSIYTTDSSYHGIICSFSMTMFWYTEKFDSTVPEILTAQPYDSSTTTFSVRLLNTNGCNVSVPSSPTEGQQKKYTFLTSEPAIPTQIEFIGMSETVCYYSMSLFYDCDGTGSFTELSSDNTFTFTQQPVTYSGSTWNSVLPSSLTVSTADPYENERTCSFVLKIRNYDQVASSSQPLETAPVVIEETRSFSVTLKRNDPCSANPLTYPEADSTIYYKYKSRTRAIPLQIPLGGNVSGCWFELRTAYKCNDALTFQQDFTEPLFFTQGKSVNPTLTEWLNEGQQIEVKTNKAVYHGFNCIIKLNYRWNDNTFKRDKEPREMEILSGDHNVQQRFSIQVENIASCVPELPSFPSHRQFIEYEYEQSSLSSQTIKLVDGDEQSCYFEYTMKYKCGDSSSFTQLISGIPQGPFTAQIPVLVTPALSESGNWQLETPVKLTILTDGAEMADETCEIVVEIAWYHESYSHDIPIGLPQQPLSPTQMSFFVHFSDITPQAVAFDSGIIVEEDIEQLESEEVVIEDSSEAVGEQLDEGQSVQNNSTNVETQSNKGQTGVAAQGGVEIEQVPDPLLLVPQEFVEKSAAILEGNFNKEDLVELLENPDLQGTANLQISDDQDINEATKIDPTDFVDLDDLSSQIGEEMSQKLNEAKESGNKFQLTKIISQAHVLPEVTSADKYGTIRFKFSTKIDTDLSFRKKKKSRMLDSPSESSVSTKSSIAEDKEKIELQRVEALLKLTKSVNLELVSESASLSEFTWNLAGYTEDELVIQINFSDISKVSQSASQNDKVMVTFQNMNLYMVPQNNTAYSPLPSNYTVSVRMPPQLNPQTKNKVQLAQDVTQEFAQYSFIFFLLFATSMQELFGSVHTLQITAHLPVLNVSMSAPLMAIFDVIITLMMFDIFPITEFIDFDFIQTDPWSEKLSWLGYGSSNFIEMMGSMFVIFVIVAAYCIATLLVYILIPNSCRCNVQCGKKKCSLADYLRNKFVPLKAKQVLNRFFMESLLELMICIAIGFKMYEIKFAWNRPEWVVVGFHSIFVVMMAIWIILTFKFVLIDMRQVIKLKIEIREAERQEFVLKHESEMNDIKEKKFKYNQKHINWYDKRNPRQQVNVESLKSQLKLKMEQFQTFECHMEKLKLEDYKIIGYSLTFMIRRATLVFLAMYFGDHPDLQIIVYVFMSMVTSVLLIHLMPFEDQSTNYIELINEVFVFSTGVVAMMLVGKAVTNADLEAQSNFFSILLYVKLSFNGLLIVWMLLKEIYGQLMKIYRLLLKVYRWCKGDKQKTVPKRYKAVKKKPKKIKQKRSEVVKPPVTLRLDQCDQLSLQSIDYPILLDGKQSQWSQPQSSQIMRVESPLRTDQRAETGINIDLVSNLNAVVHDNKPMWNPNHLSYHKVNQWSASQRQMTQRRYQDSNLVSAKVNDELHLSDMSLDTEIQAKIKSRYDLGPPVRIISAKDYFIENTQPYGWR